MLFTNGKQCRPPKRRARAGAEAACAAELANNGATQAPVGGTRTVNRLRDRCLEEYHLMRQKATQQRLTREEELLAEAYLEGYQVCTAI